MAMLIVSKYLNDVKNNFVKYAAGIILTPYKKNCTNIAEVFNVPHDQIYQILRSEKKLLPLFPELLIDMIKYFSSIKKGYLILDDSLISKTFSKFIEGTDFAFNGSTGKTELGLSTVILAWTNGDVTIPLDFEFWLSKEILKENHVTKIQLAQYLIKKRSSEIAYEGVILDGLYSSIDMINFFNEHEIKFEMRIASNRVVTAENSIRAPLREHRGIRLRRNERTRTFSAFWKEVKLYFTAEKRKNKNGEYTIVYLVSNRDTSSKEHVNIYAYRWEIEKFFRTSKQHLGLAQCSARGLQKQRVHIFNVFYSYAFLQFEKYKLEFSSVECVINHLQEINPWDLVDRISSLDQIFHGFA